MNRKERFIPSDIPIIIATILIIIFTLYPVIYVVSMSFSEPSHVLARDVYLLPKGFSLKAYRMILDNATVLRSFANTLWYTVVGAAASVTLTATTAFVLSRKRFFLRRQLSLLMTLTMFISGGLVPLYILVQKMHLYNTRWAIVLPYIISAYNLIIMRTSFESIPDTLIEAAKLDGAGDFTILFRVALPISNAVVAVMVLFYAVEQWNSWFPAFIYLKNRELWPLQLVLREIIIENNVSDMLTGVDAAEMLAVSESIKYATIVVATLPILCIYPFLQKYFVKGVMIGAVKG